MSCDCPDCGEEHEYDDCARQGCVCCLGDHEE